MLFRSEYSPLRLMGLGLSAMLIPLGSTMIAVALPSIGAEFARNPGELTQWLVNSYLLVGIIAQGPGGKLGDHWGYAKTLRLGQWIFGAGCVLAVFSNVFAAIVASRVLMALGGALIVPTVMAVFKITVPVERRHRVFSYFGAMMGFAAALGPSLGGVLVQHFGWVSIFLMNLPPLLLSVFFAKGFFSQSSNQVPSRSFAFDWFGTLLMAMGLLCFVMGLKEFTALLLLAALFFSAFVWWEKKSPAPLMDLALFSDRSFAVGCAIVGLQNLGMYALIFQLPYLLKLLYQWGPERAGPFMTTFMLSMMVATVLGGRAAEKFGARATCVVGSLISVAGMCWLSLLTPGHDASQVIGGLIMGGVGLGLANGPAQSAALGSVEQKHSGVASGILSTCRYLGGVVGIAILGLLLSAPESAESLSQYHAAIMAFAVSFAISALVALGLPGRATERAGK